MRSPEIAQAVAQWRERYVVRLMANLGLSREDAEANFEAMDSAGSGEDAMWSLDESPEDAADDEALEWRASQ